MGKGRDKRKKHEDPEKAQKRADRQRTKLSRAAEGGAKEGENKLEGLNGEENIIETAARYQKLENKRKNVQEVELTSAPSPRSNCVFGAYPNREGEFVIFGGEFWDGENTQTYNDLFVYNVFKNKWRQITAPCTPCPRSSCQGWTHKQYLYIHGGEIVSRSQSQFMHFKDLWRIDLQTCVWEELTKGKGGPSARSGHRIAPYKKGGAVLFGGFFDNGQQTNFYDDLWVLTEVEAGGVWNEVLLPQFAERPHPRSGHSIAVHGDEVFLFGGYYTFRENRFKRAEATVLHDLWTINLASETPLWQKLKLAGIPPPIRSGMGFCQKDKKLFLWGGVVDLDGPGGKTVSSFHNDLYIFNMETKKFFPVLLKMKKKKTGAGAAIAEGSSAGGGSKATKQQGNSLADEIAAVAGKKVVGGNQDDDTSSSDDDSSSDSSSSDDDDNNNDEKKNTENNSSNEPPKTELSAITLKNGQTIPCPRMNPQMVAHSHFLLLYGGVFEIGKREVSLSDFFSLNMNTLETYTAHHVTDVRTIPWNGVAAGDSGSDAGSWEEGSTVAPEMMDNLMDDLDEEDENENSNNNNNNDDDDDDDQAPNLFAAKLNAAGGGVDLAPAAGDSRTNIRGKIGKGHHLEQLKQQLSGTSIVPTPVVGETLDQFTSRTELFWLNSSAEDLYEMKDFGLANKNQRKRITKSAHELARIRFLEATDLIRQIDDIERQLVAEREVLREHLKQRQQRIEEEIAAEQQSSSSSSSSDNDDDDEKKEGGEQKKE